MFERAMGHMYKQWLMWKRSPADMALVIVYPLVSMLSIGLFAAFVIVVAAAEVAVALAIVLTMYRIIKSVNLDRADTLKG